MRVQRNNRVETTGVSSCSLFKACLMIFTIYLNPVLGSVSKSSLSEIELEQLKGMASKFLVEKCESNLAKLSGNLDSAQFSEAELLEVKSVGQFKIGERKPTLLILGCLGNGELLLIDSTKDNPSIIRKEINIPGRHAVLGEIQDLNNDSIPELRIDFSAGAHGFYSSFVSLYQDSLCFLLIAENATKFFALTGGIMVLDLDNDSTMEIKIGPDLNKPDSTQFEIYKWTGTEYSKIAPK